MSEDSDKALARTIAFAAVALEDAINAARSAGLVVEVDYKDIDVTTYDDVAKHRAPMYKVNIDLHISRTIRY